MLVHAWLVAWLKSEEAQDLVEYTVVIGLVLVVAIVTQGFLGGNVSTLWVKLSIWMNGIGAAANVLSS